MKAKMIHRMIWSLSLIALSVSCTVELKERAPEFGISPNQVNPVSAKTTFRILAYNSDNSLAGSGTYYLKNQKDAHLTPCKLKADGTYVSDIRKEVLTLPEGTYRFVYVSPGISNATDGTIAFDANQTTTALRVTAPEEKAIGQYGLVTMNGALREPRATVRFKLFLKKGTTGEMTVPSGNVQVDGAARAGDMVLYHPVLRTVKRKVETANLSLNVTGGQTGQDAVGNTLKYVSDQASVASGIYSGNGLVFKTRIAIGGKNVDLNLPLLSDRLPEILPQHNYVFNVIASSTDIKVVVEIVNDQNNPDWQTGGTGGVEIGPAGNMVRVDLGVWKIVGDRNDWTVVNPGDQVIDG